MMSQVITYRSPTGATIDLTESQIAWLDDNDLWPTDSQGWEFCSVSHGLHHGVPTYSDEHLKRAMGAA